mgnify:CR=1 FL=1
MKIRLLADRGMTIKVSTLGKWRSSGESYADKPQHFDKNGRLLFVLQQRTSENLCNFNKVSWCEGVYYKVSVEAK